MFGVWVHVSSVPSVRSELSMM